MVESTTPAPVPRTHAGVDDPVRMVLPKFLTNPLKLVVGFSFLTEHPNRTAPRGSLNGSGGRLCDSLYAQLESVVAVVVVAGGPSA